MSSHSVSIVVPCFARPDQTHALLTSLRAATVQCEIVIVDDASPQPLEGVIAEFEDLHVRYIRLSRNRGAAYARNIGVASGTADYIAFTDNDCVVSPGWLDHISESLRRAPERVAGVGGRVIALRDDIFSRYYDYHKILDPWYFRGRNYYVTTANSIFRRAPFESVGGFDEDVPGAGGEDPGLCFKLQNAGYELGYNPDALIYHQYAPSLRAFMRTFFRYGYGCAGQSGRHYRRQPFVQSIAFGAIDVHGG